MATDTAGIQSTIGTNKQKSFFTPGDPQKPVTVELQRFSEHYVSNNGPATIPTAGRYANANPSQNPVNFPCPYNMVVNQGWVNIPYTNPGMAGSQDKWDAIQLNCEKFRIKGCGFEIIDIDCVQSDVAAVGTSTTVSNKFVDCPIIAMAIDEGHRLASQGTIGDTTTNIGGLGNLTVDPGYANHSLPGSQGAGLLPAVKFIIPCTAATVALDPELAYDVFSNVPIKWLGTDSKRGDDKNTSPHHYWWENPDTERWMAPLEVGNDNNPLTDETAVNQDIYNPNGNVAMTAAILANLATNVYRNLKDAPVAHLLRPMPKQAINAPIYLAFSIKIMYKMTVEFIPGSILTTRYIAGSEGTILPGNMLPFPANRRSLHTLSANQFPPPTLRREGRDEMDGASSSGNRLQGKRGGQTEDDGGYGKKIIR